MPVTHSELATRRRRMANEMAKGKRADDVAREFGVSAACVRRACHEYGVRISGYNRVLDVDKFRAVKLMLDGKTDSQIHRLTGISCPCLGVIRMNARKAGLL